MPGGRLPTVRGRELFRSLARSPRRAHSGPVTVHFVPEDRAAEPARAVPADRDVPGEPGIPSPQGGGTVRVAYAVGRPTGSAVVRNRYRRRLRVITAEFAPELPPGAYLVRLAPDVARLGFEELRERVRTSMRAASRSGR